WSALQPPSSRQVHGADSYAAGTGSSSRGSAPRGGSERGAALRRDRGGGASRLAPAPCAAVRAVRPASPSPGWSSIVIRVGSCAVMATSCADEPPPEKPSSPIEIIDCRQHLRL